MSRWISILAMTAATVFADAGCRHCGDSSPRLVGRSDACCDPVVGTPVSNGQMGIPSTLIPGRPMEELQYPQPNGMIPVQPGMIPVQPGMIPAQPGIPVQPATPTPAPGDQGANVLPAPKFGVPVKDIK